MNPGPGGFNSSLFFTGVEGLKVNGKGWQDEGTELLADASSFMLFLLRVTIPLFPIIFSPSIAPGSAHPQGAERGAFHRFPFKGRGTVGASREE